MTRRTPLTTLIELQRRARDDSARLAARSRRESAAAESTLQMLEDYHADHVSRAPDIHSPAFSPGTLRIREAFGQRLEKAIGEQGTVARQLDDAVAEKERALIDRQRRLKALETLAQRRKASARQHEARREQAGTDEFALQSYLRTRKDRDA